MDGHLVVGTPRFHFGLAFVDIEKKYMDIISPAHRWPYAVAFLSTHRSAAVFRLREAQWSSLDLTQELNTKLPTFHWHTYNTPL
jgi:hypothetical protein